MNRRDFLRPQRLAKAAVDLFDAAQELETALVEPPPEDHDFDLLRFTRRAMATDFEVLVPYGTPHALEAAEEALDEIDRLEAQLTVYRDDSEVSRLNQQAEHGPVPVESGLFDLLALAAQIHRDTAGAYDITTGVLTRAWGFFRRAGRVPTEAELQNALACTGMNHVVLDVDARSVRFLRPWVEINLGSIGKGYALDCAAAVLRRWQIGSALLHGGKSSVYAVGSPPGESRGWPVALRHPWQRERQLAVVRLRDRALGTSATTFQHIEQNGKKLGHLLDPRTGWPADGVASTTAIAPTAAEADALATAFFVLGVDGTRRYGAEHCGFGAVLLPNEENAAPVVIGIPPEEICVSPGFASAKSQE